MRSLESLVDLNRQMSPGTRISFAVEDGFPTSLAGGNCVEVVRIIQEALTNARRHAEASNVTVTLGSDGESVRVKVEDDGEGFDLAASRGVGIVGMEERARALGGDLAIKSGEKGTRIRISFALASVEKGSRDSIKT